ncbi:MAG: biopolymer transporter ExbD [bacterium]|nr:biopolymer transporter ExbD [bacterium]
MAVPKAKRMGIAMDMTPMVDVAFLLLIFFMSTTQFKPPEDTPVSLPDSHSSIKLPESDVLTITITKADTSKNRLVANSSRILISTGIAKVDQRLGFSAMNQELGQFRSVPQSKETLPDNIMRARMDNPKLRLIIKADERADYATVASVNQLLQDENLLRFYLITDLEK